MVKPLKILKYKLLEEPVEKKSGFFYRFPSWVTAIGIFIITLVLISPSFYYSEIKFSRGEPISQTVYAPFRIDIVDEQATQRLQAQAEERYHRHYEYNSQVENEVIANINTIFQWAMEARENKELEAKGTVSGLQLKVETKFGATLSEEAIATLLHHAYDAKFQDNLKEIAHQLLAEHGLIKDKYDYAGFEQKGVVELSSKHQQPEGSFTSDQMLNYPEEMRDYLRERAIPRFFRHKEERQAGQEISELLLRPNIVFLKQRTVEDRNKELESAGVVTRTFNKGDMVIRRNQEVTPFYQQILSSINAKTRYYNMVRVGGDGVFVLGVFLLMLFFLRRYCPHYKFTPRNILLLSLPVLLALFLGRVFLTYIPDTTTAGYVFPAGVIGMLGIILLTPMIGFALVTCGILLFALMVDLNFRFIAVAFFGGLTALYSLYTIKERKDILMTGFKIALVNFIAIIIINFIETPTSKFMEILNTTSWGLVNGIICAFVTLPSLPLFEYFFGITTDVRLLELTGIRHPLIEQLEEKAPGTYQHSLNVAKMAESAARDIGANYLLVRAGAYFHDVGKILKPKYFSENQVTSKDKQVYTKVTPHMSALIVKNHVKEGIELARKHGLPAQVIDFIPQHHGTSLIKYFYDEAKKSSANDLNIKVEEDEFRYPGPKPQTIEMAIVMLADAVEATATSRLSQNSVTESQVRRLVNDTIAEKFYDGQFDECNLTLKDLHIINESFIKTLLSRFHFRISYPSPYKKEAKEPSRPEPAPTPRK